MVDRRPAVITQPMSADDVAAAVRFARDSDLEISVRCGGHSVVGHGVADGGLMIDLSRMRAVRVDPEGRRAWVQGGAELGDLDRATQQFGLATTAGNVSHTGVGGLTLGGGMGWLARECGLACDNVEAFELVTADGERLRATNAQNADLFWGLRGGGGNFGVVTEFEFRLHQVGMQALIADFVFDADDGHAIMRGWRELLHDAPRLATPTAWVGTSREWAFLGPEYWNRPVVIVGYVWVGDPEEGERLVPQFRSLGHPIGESVTRMSYLDLQTSEDVRQRQPMRRYWKGHYLNELGDAAITAYLSRGASDGNGRRSELPAGGFQAYGGAIAEVGPMDTAFSHRDALVEFVTVAHWSDPAEDEAQIVGPRAFASAIEPFACGVYVNDLADEGESGVRRAYRSSSLERLEVLKAKYDPDNVFHLNHNIRPRVTAAK